MLETYNRTFEIFVALIWCMIKCIACEAVLMTMAEKCFQILILIITPIITLISNNNYQTYVFMRL
jgi:hypothetical protein